MNTAQRTIAESSRYDSFLYNTEQRPICPAHVKGLMESMSTWGFLPSKPIQVYKRQNKHVIIDGHHRFLAAKNLGIDILFVVEPQSHQNSISDGNFRQKKWVIADFVTTYANRGIPAYKELLEYLKLGIPITKAAGMLSGNAASQTTNGTLGKSLYNGTFEVKSREKIEKIAQFLREHGHENKAYHTNHFICSLELFMRFPDFDLERLTRRLANNPKMVCRMATLDQMLDQLEEVYNYHQQIKVPIAFNAREKKKAKFTVKP